LTSPKHEIVDWARSRGSGNGNSVLSFPPSDQIFPDSF
jgi:hypothetical protein